ncbi:Mth938-like domain-containing protein [Chitinimonas lacunae]|uniref:Mth938-like domain-containing protein n=1 Tax=Chitinimonas lacunae TaxID=1963018 RepID=A0ABV8MPT8_9NEIS
MKLHANASSKLNVFTGYGLDYVNVNLVRHQGSLVVTPEAVKPWRPAGFDDLQEQDFTALLELKPEVVLLGTGSQLRFPHPRLTQGLLHAHVGVDAMDLSALCRTFNILVGEDRRVVALVLFN